MTMRWVKAFGRAVAKLLTLKCREAAELVSGEAIAGWVAAEVDRLRAETGID